MNFQINIGGKACNVICFSTSQTRDTFETFDDNLKLTLDTLTNNNPLIIN